jgi:DNA-binding CsgD family transcriptional regulator
MEKEVGLIGEIYEAALNAEAWPRLIESIASSCNAQGGMLRSVDATSGDVSFMQTMGYDSSYVKAYRAHYFRLDPYRDFFNDMPVGHLADADHFIEPRRRRRSEYYNDYERPQDKEFVVGGTLDRCGSLSVQFGIHRGRRAGGFDADVLKWLAILAPHIARAVHIHRQTTAVALREQIALAALDELRVGVILVDSSCRPVYANREAESTLAAAGCRWGRDGIFLPRPNETHQLAALIAAAARGAPRCGGEMTSSARHFALQWQVLPLDRRRLPKCAQPAADGAAIFVCRPGPLRLSWRSIAIQFGLSPAEARLAATLADGTSLEAAAESLSISIHTARTQLKSIFSKCGVRRQGELVATLMQGVLACCRAPERDA